MNAGEKIPKRRNIVGERVKVARKKHIPALTQDQLSGKLATEGVELDRVAIAKIETGVRCVFDFELRGLAKALKVDVASLLGIAGRHGEEKTRSGGPRVRGI